MFCAKLLLCGRLSCAGIAKLWVSVPGPVVAAKCKKPNPSCAVNFYRLLKMPKCLMDSYSVVQGKTNCDSKSSDVQIV